MESGYHFADVNGVRHFATYFDRHFLSRGVALHASLLQHSSPFVLWILCFDEETARVVTDLELEHVRLLHLTELERADPALLSVKSGRLTHEYYWTCGPAFLLHLLDRDPEIDNLTYLDADLFFFDDPTPIFNELAGNSVLLVEHRRIKEPDDPRDVGRINMGLVALSRTSNALACVRRWREQCLEWCFDRHEDGKFGDQSYLDEWPDRFADVTILKHRGGGLAPWNVMGARLRLEGGRLFNHDVPVLFYHFSKLRRVNRWLYETHDWRFHRHELAGLARQQLYLPYVRALHTAEKRLRTVGGFASQQKVDRSPSLRALRKQLASNRQLGVFARSRRFVFVTDLFEL